MQRLRKDDSFSNNPRLEIQNWSPFADAPRRAHSFMPSFMKGLQSRPCHCRPSHVLSGRPSIGQKRVWLLFLTWSYTTFLLHGINTLTIAKWREHSCTGTYIKKIITMVAVEGANCITFQPWKKFKRIQHHGIAKSFCKGHNGKWAFIWNAKKAKGLAGNFSFCISACQKRALQPHAHSSKKAAVHGTTAAEWATCDEPLAIGKWVDSCIGI